MTTLGPPRARTTDEEEAGEEAAGEAPHAAGGRRTPLLPRPRRAGDGERGGEGHQGGGAARPRSRLQRLHRRLWRWLRHPVVAALAVGSVLHLLWLWLIANGGGDLAAQDAWAEFVGQNPGSAYNLAWYGGMHPVSYSVLSPYLMAGIGVRPTLILSGVLSGGVLALLLMRSGAVRRPLVPALCGAFAFVCNAGSGRVTFALGTLFALCAVAAVWAWPARWSHRRKARAAAAVFLSVLATAGSPMAGLFLEVVAGALLVRGRWRAALALGVPLPVVVGLTALLFPFSGVQPMPWPSIVFPLAISVLVRLLTPREWPTVRRGAEIYTLGVLLTWAIPTQVGSNVERLGQLFGGVVLVAMLPPFRHGQPLRVGDPPRLGRRVIAVLSALVVSTGFQVGKPIYDVVHTIPEAAWAHDLAPLLHELKQVDAERGRVEVVPVRSHRGASAIAPYVNLARGWNRQADTERNPLFYEEGALTPERYYAWLRRWAVRYVVLPMSDTPDVAARDEARLVRAGQPYLNLVWKDENWRLYRVQDPLPLATLPAHDVRAEADEVTLKVRHAGEVLVRIPWSPWLGLVTAKGEHVEAPERVGQTRNGCLRPAEPRPVRPRDGNPSATQEGSHGDDGQRMGTHGTAAEYGLGLINGEGERLVDQWTILEAPRPGTYHIAAPYELPRGTPCPQPEGDDSAS